MADVWACGTTLWEIFMYGEEILQDNGIDEATQVRVNEINRCVSRTVFQSIFRANFSRCIRCTRVERFSVLSERQEIIAAGWMSQ